MLRKTAESTCQMN